jgi:ribulose-5-phosphate 4-epimerase/fuculose-1-phosphate aldolase
MTETANPIIMNTEDSGAMPSQSESAEDVRRNRKNKLADSLRLFGKFGFDEGVAGHITVRDPELTDHLWVNHTGEVVEGEGLLNGAAFTVHSRIHMANPKVMAATQSHSVYGKTFSSLGKLPDPITQDSCAFYRLRMHSPNCQHSAGWPDTHRSCPGNPPIRDL